MPLRPTLSLVVGSTLPGALGLCVTNLAGIAAATNEAQESLMIDPMAPEEGWWAGWATGVFNLQIVQRHAYLVTAWDVARAIVMDVCTRPIRIRNGFYEYLQFGTGLRPKPCNACSQPIQAYERDTVPTLTDFPSTPSKLRFYPLSSADIGKKIQVQGVDANGNIVYGVDTVTQLSILGESVYLAAPFVETLNTYSKITGILKASTLDTITIFAVDPNTGIQTQISSMEPHELTANYRRYLLDGLPANCCQTANGIVQVSAQVRFDFVPALSPSDPLVIACIPAIIQQALFHKYEKQDTKTSAALADRHHTMAIRYLFGQLDAFQGKTSVAINVPLFGSQKLIRQPV